MVLTCAEERPSLITESKGIDEKAKSLKPRQEELENKLKEEWQLDIDAVE